MKPTGAPRTILFFEGAQDGTTGGSHQSLYDVVRHLDRKRFEPVVAFNEDNRFVAALRGLDVAVHVLERERALERRAEESGSALRRLGSALQAALRRARLLRLSGTQLFHLNNSPWSGLDDWIPAATAMGIPCVANSMGPPYTLPARQPRRSVARRVRYVRAISEHVARELSCGGWDPRRIRTVHLSVDARSFEGSVRHGAAEMRARLGIPADHLVIAMVGNIKAWKGQRLVVEAASQLPAALKERLTLLFIGATSVSDRDYLAQLESDIRKTGLERRVQLLGSRTDVADLVGASDVLVHASIVPEPFGLVVVEGMILGKAVIAAGSGGPREILTEGSGLLFEPGNARDLSRKLAQVASDPALRARLGSAARQRARDFAVEREVEALQDLYEEILPRPQA